jgi:hypothetical protein
MPHPIEQRVAAVRRSAIRWVHIHGLCWAALVTTGILVGFGLVDSALRLEDVGARWMLSLLAGGAILLAVWKLYLPAWRYRPSLVEVARRIEHYFPTLDQRLSSAMDFLAQDEADPTAGSPGLRRAVVAEADALSTNLEFGLAIDSRRPRRIWFFAFGAMLVALVGAIALDDGRPAGLALARLAMPWHKLSWPRRNELEFVRRPDKIASGDDFEVELVDRNGRLPDVVQIQIRHSTSTGTRTETKEMNPLADRMAFRLENVTQPFAYRARGGDDDTMPWTQVAVIDPPQVVSLDLSIQPPAYTRIPRQSAGRVVRAIAGSALSLAGRVDKPIVSAALKSQTRDGPLPAIQVAADGLRFSAPASGGPTWTIESSAGYWLEMTDASGLVSGRDARLEIHVLPDLPPSLAWETPADHTFVTPRAVVGLKCLVKDDLAIKNVQLRYLRPGMSDQGELLTTLYAGPAEANPPAAMGDGENHAVEHAWDLSQLAGLRAGDVLALRLTAEDYKPQTATTVVRRLTIITDEELESRLGQRQASILSQLAEALRLERDCRQQLASLEIRLAERGQLDESDLNHLQSAQLNQRQVEKLLGAGAEGVEGQIEALLAEIAANRIEGQAMSQRMNDLLAKVQSLNRQPLVEISQRLTEAFKALREAMDGCAEEGGIGDSLGKAAARQDEVIQALETMLGALAEWDSFSRLSREISQIRGDQEKLSAETDLLARRAAAATELPAEDRATARQLSQRELELARRLDKIQARMEEMLGRLTATDPVAAGTLADALDAARRLAIGGQMRDAAGRLTALEFGRSRQTQQGVLDGLKQLLDLLSSRREDELARTAKSLRDAAGELSGLIGRQAAVQAELDAAAGLQDPMEKKRQLERLTKELEQLAQEIDKLSRKLQRLRAPQAATPAQEAGRQAAAAGQSAGQGDAGQAQQQSRTTRQRLEEAQRELVKAIAQVEEELARQLMARMEQWLAGLLARQKNVVAETARLDAARQAAGDELPPAERESLRNLAAEQRLIGDETEQLRLRMAEVAAFTFALEGAEQEMLRAAAMLLRGETGAATQAIEQAAATRLEHILTALKPDDGSAAAEKPPGQQEPPPAAAQPNAAGGNVAELKLLQLLQGEIRRRTAELEAIRAKQGKLEGEQLRELDGLAQQQGRLADMVLNLIRAATARPEDDPDSLPGLTPGGEKKPEKKPSLDEELLRDLEK